MARDCHDLVRRRAGLGQRGRGSLAHPMRRAVRKVGLAAPVLELVSESVRRERLAVFGDQKRHVADLRRRDALRECRMQWNVDLDRIAMLILRLAELDTIAPDVLTAEPWCVLAPARRVT